MENRYFFRMRIGDRSFEALFDPGAMISVISPQVAEPYKSRIQPYGVAGVI